jgi:hypothetical protein
MIFKLKPYEDKLIEEIYEQGMEHLGKFYESNWTENRPQICILDSRAEIDKWRGGKTEPWVVGWANNGRVIYLLNYQNYAAESDHTFHAETFPGLIIHELSHLFYGVLSHENASPRWLCEGTAIYSSGQLKFKKPIEKFKNFLDFQKNSGAEIYDESGFVVKLLIDNFGKKKLLKLIKAISGINTKAKFDKTFTDIYGFKMTYSTANKLLNKK